MCRLPEYIECPRLSLRRWRPDDAELLGEAVAASLDHLRPWMDWADDEPIGLDERRALIATWHDDWERGTDAIYGVLLGDTVVGGCGLHRRGTPDTLHIGYWVHVDHVGQGYAREIAAGLTTAGFTVPGIARVEIHHADANHHSRAVPDALGFTLARDQPEHVASSLDGTVAVRWYVDASDWRGRTDG